MSVAVSEPFDPEIERTDPFTESLKITVDMQKRSFGKLSYQGALWLRGELKEYSNEWGR